ncbi:MAG: hypothetical protein IJZ46_04265 [Bacilli bacterium]|nr:hypothetical protein [Bacilli bacterium]
MKKDDIKTLIVVAVVCITCVLLILILNIKSNSEKLTPVNEYDTFFSTSNYINNYLSYISSNNSNAVISLLHNEYIVYNNITESNLLDSLEAYPENTNIKVDYMEYVKIKDNYVYYVKGTIVENGYNERNEIDKDFEILVMVDYNNMAISLYPLEGNNYKKVIDKIKKVNIEKNKYNTILESPLITKEQICVTYLSDYLETISNDINVAYELLSKSMKKTYTTVDSYNEFINSNINKFTTTADKCKLDTIDEKRVYSVIDKNDNRYIFNESSIMNYTVDIYLAN